jgi:formyltetrahydrofolate synthetase
MRDRFLAPTSGIREDLIQEKSDDIETMGKLINALQEAETACKAWLRDTERNYELADDIQKLSDNLAENISVLENKQVELYLDIERIGA